MSARETAYVSLRHIDADAVLVSVVFGAVLHYPVFVNDSLVDAVRRVYPLLGQLFLLDGRALSVSASLRCNRHNYIIDDLTITVFQSLCS